MSIIKNIKKDKIEDILKGLDDSCVVTLTDEKGKIIYVNDAFCKLTKYSKEELVGQTHHILNSGFHSEDFWNDFWSTISVGEIWRGEIKNKAKDGSYYWAYATIIPLKNDDGEIARYMAIRSDITSKKKLEEDQFQRNSEAILLKEKEINQLRHALSEKKEFSGFIGEHSSIVELIETVKKVANTNYSVVILGESGTGKEVIAKMIHHESDRSDQDFLPIDAGAIPEPLFESEFFGHQRGSFTDASESKKGYFEKCNKGSLFLDEIGNLSVSNQTKLLRVLQEKQVKPVGKSKSIKVDVRMIFAANVELEGNPEFREDLYHRMAECVIRVPSLRERGNDILLLANKFLIEVSDYLRKDLSFHIKTREALLHYDWPGNVRELKNKIRQAALMADNEILPMHMFFKENNSTEESRDNEKININIKENKTYNEQIFEFEKKLIIETLNLCDGNKLKAATKLGMYYATFCRKLNKF